jgi:hypothetical protein
MTTHKNRSADDGGTTAMEPTVAAAVVVPTATPPPHPSRQRWLHLMAPLPRPLDWHFSDVAWFREGDVQQPLPSAMLAGALPYGLSP